MVTVLRHVKDNIVFYLTGALFSLFFSGLRFTNLMNNWVGYDRYVSFTIDAPFVHRVLIPGLIKGLLYFIPNQELLFQAFEFLGTFATLVAFRLYLQLFIPKRLASIFSFSFFLVAPYIMLLPRFLNLWYPYDQWGIFFNIVLLHFLYQKKWTWFYCIFPVAFLNRETTFFITIVMWLTSLGKENIKTILAHTVVQVSIMLSFKMFLVHYFASLGGVNFTTDSHHTWEFFKAIIMGPFTGSSAKALFDLAFILGNFAYVWVYVLFKWQSLDNSFFKRSFLVLIPFYGSVIYVGNIYETRVFGEMIPIVLAPAIYLLVQEINPGLILDRKKAKLRS